MQTVAIVGVGLIGGSFGLALRKAGFEGDILGVSSPRSVSAALERGAISHGVTLEEAAAKADLIFLSQPISGIIRTLDDLEPMLIGRRVIVTDVGSTKVRIEERARARLKDAFFIGGHPMAGKEVRGVEAADADLFRDRPWIITSFTDTPAAQQFLAYLKEFGAKPIHMDAETHDRTVAWGSHLPQILSSTLAALLAQKAPATATIAGPGLIDMTRLAMSSYDLWKDIIDTNHSEIAGALEAFAKQLRSAGNTFEETFAAGGEFAHLLREPKNH